MHTLRCVFASINFYVVTELQAATRRGELKPWIVAMNEIAFLDLCWNVLPEMGCTERAFSLPYVSQTLFAEVNAGGFDSET